MNDKTEMEEMITPGKWLLPIMWWGFGHNILQEGLQAKAEGSFLGIQNEAVLTVYALLCGLTFMGCAAAAVMALVVAFRR